MTVATTITALGQKGEGLTQWEGQRLFVPKTLPGEQVLVDVAGERGALVEVLEPSADRVEPFCPYFRQCGGCALQHAGPQTYAAFKRGLVQTALQFAGLDCPVGEVVDARGAGRRRASLHVRGTRAGYMRFHSHELLDIAVCPILEPGLRERAPAIAHAFGVVIGDCEISFTASATGLDVGVQTERKLKPESLAPLFRQFRLARLAVNGELVLQAQAPVVRMGKAQVELPIGSFLQATHAAETELAAMVAASLKGAKTVADLFCGVGPFALRLAERAKVFAADADKPAIEALRNAVRATQGLKQIVAERRDLFREPLTRFELNRFDAVVIDPPRAGAQAQARELAASTVKTVVSVSCDPRSFARDAAILYAGGYRLESVNPIDQFAFSPHVEVVGLFHR
jgi:23S rRNA (uracil1939-C5)-methyltransferase